ncbi:hypothetical protein TNCV_541811 [Trichonephila clavipes]|nr:hypothetical protein TNCV_541811 [Trichonephila clavipes]
MYHCVFYYSLRNNLSNLAENCGEPCVSYRYQSEVSCMGLGIANMSDTRTRTHHPTETKRVLKQAPVRIIERNRNQNLGSEACDH